MRTARSARILLLALTMAACATGTGAVSPQDPAPARRDRNLITAEELASETEMTAYDAIRHLRPEMLTARGAGLSQGTLTPGANASDAGQIMVYLNDGKMPGGIADLRTLPISGIKEIRFLTSADATQRFGTGNTAGAIVLSTR